MKKILPVLLCYVLSASQMYAVSGGPVFSSGVSPVGSYSGVIEGITETDDLSASAPPIPGDPLGGGTTSDTTPSNALGLFDLTVPSIGLAAGTFVLFEDGIVFTGTIQASANPNSDKLIGILQASFTFMLTTFNDTGNAVVTTTAATAVGQINAKVVGANDSATSLGSLTGTANLDVSFGEVDPSTLEPIIARSTTFNVIGIKQSAVDTASTGSGGVAGTTSSGG